MPSYDELSAMAEYVREHKPDRYEWPNGDHSGIHYGEDEDGDTFALVGYNLPEHIYAEIDSDTYGTLQGFRVYL